MVDEKRNLENIDGNQSKTVMTWVIGYGLCQFAFAAISVPGTLSSAYPSIAIFVYFALRFVLPFILCAVLIGEAQLMAAWLIMHVGIALMFMISYPELHRSITSLANAVVLFGGVYLIWRARE